VSAAEAVSDRVYTSDSTQLQSALKQSLYAKTEFVLMSFG
jgi:hypothetical protein